MVMEDPMESDYEQLVVCDTRDEMIRQFEEYKRNTRSGWRCIKSNDPFGRFNRLDAHSHLNKLNIN